MQRGVRPFLLLLLVVGAPGCGVTQVVDKAHDGTPILIRAPQPDEGDIKSLSTRYGVQTVVNLRGEQHGERWFEEERRAVERIGARWVQLRTSGKSEPPPESVEQFFALVEDPANWPIVLHCQGGIHRTGLWAALYRIQYQGWSPERAIAEMEDLYFDWSITDREALKRWLRRYRRDPDRQVARAGGRTTTVAAASPPAPDPGPAPSAP
ncbi:MAG: tyrosine-protein phosphatase [Planctomycetes bacterium]|nr:tyrosine-protein phosphatase [Planctomycetota bacterium]